VGGRCPVQVARVETLVLKVSLAPALVLGVTLAARRWGPRLGGMLIALPLVAGSILLVITLEHGEVFAARAARGALLGVVALSAFCVAFAAHTSPGAARSRGAQTERICRISISRRYRDAVWGST
jgi:hypothetical protein